MTTYFVFPSIVNETNIYFPDKYDHFENMAREIVFSVRNFSWNPEYFSVDELSVISSKSNQLYQMREFLTLSSMTYFSIDIDDQNSIYWSKYFKFYLMKVLHYLIKN